MGGKAKFYGETDGKVWLKLQKLSFSREIKTILPILPRKDTGPFLHISDPNYLSFNLKYPSKCQETCNCDILSNLSPDLHLSSSKIFGKTLILLYPSMCILLKLDYVKFSISSLCFSKFIDENPWGRGRLAPPPIGKGRVKQL